MIFIYLFINELFNYLFNYLIMVNYLIIYYSINGPTNRALERQKYTKIYKHMSFHQEIREIPRYFSDFMKTPSELVISRIS